MRNNTDVHAKRKYLRRYGCLTYFQPHVVKNNDVGTALQPKRKRGIHLGFSDKNSAWLVGSIHEGKFSVYETRNAIFCEEILVQNVSELDSPEPPLLQQLLDLANAAAGEGSTAGVGLQPTAGVGAHDRLQGLKEIQWEADEESTPNHPSSGVAGNLAPPLLLDKLNREDATISGRKRKHPSTTESHEPGETTSLFSA